MRKALMVCAVLALATAALAAEDKPLGDAHFGLKGAYLAFTDSDLKDAKVDTGPIGGAELYLGIFEGLYIGVEGAFAQNKGTVHQEGIDIENKLTYVPIELNAKYVIPLAKWLALDVGGGGCYNYVKVEASGDGMSESDTDWVIGGQGFANLNFIVEAFYIGVDAKYQLTKKFKDDDFNLNNWHVGGHLA